MIFKFFYPELFLSIAIIFQLLFNTRIVTNGFHKSFLLQKETFMQTFFILISVLLLLLLNLDIISLSSNSMFLIDKSSHFIKIFFIIISLIVLLFIKKSFFFQKLNFFEFYTLFLLSILAGLLLINATDLLTIYLLIEMQALCFYILAGFKRNSTFSSEAGLKYFIYGSIISCFFLLGLCILYSILGTLNLSHLSILTSFTIPSYSNNFINFAIFLITITFLFKLGAAPFHIWVADVYEGAPLSATLIFSIISKPILIFLFIKWILSLNCLYQNIELLLIFVGTFSSLVGTLLALKQKRFKRLIIYSSVAQVGYIVLSISMNNYLSIVGSYFFLFIYIITSILIWGYIVIFYSFKFRFNTFFQKLETSIFITDLSNLFKINSLMSFIILLTFFSISGIPPFSGFIAKILILKELTFSGFITISILLLICSSISIFYYIRILKIIFFEISLKKKNLTKNIQIIFDYKTYDTLLLIIVICSFLIIFFSFFPNILLLCCQILVLNTYFF